MSKVTRCDICGKVFEHYGENATNYGSFRAHPRCTCPEDYQDPTITDCCPECTKKIEDFIDVLMTGEEYCIYIGTMEN